ncbi:uncharacterized protein LOC107643134 isoform X2 [Arachis ipaensis]|uniref:uncharacterized protein LOC107643134 isoform X2 n=1 Tax=Arachis ipaensis TaxID=130454 RepID=UPI000A2B914B|nr:uncharacterized protein LOC107643134 isoform X2 [Arachis ipaensis]
MLAQPSLTILQEIHLYNPALYTAVPSSVTDDAWHLDTGASHHVTHDQSNLLSSSEYQGPDQVRVGNGAGIEVHQQSEGQIHLSQTRYIENLLSKVEMTSASPMPTPMISSLQLMSSESKEFEDPSLYRSVVGALQYVTVTRPDLSFAVCKVSQFMHRPLVSHWKAVKKF